MSIVRINHDKENPYTLINKTALEDDDLSWAAKGLWSYLISRPDNWNVSVKHLVSSFQKEGKKGGGRDAVHNLLNELIEFGYCIRIQHKTSKGLFDSYEYIILEHKKLKETLPKQDKPDPVPCRDKANTVKPDYNNKGSKINNEKIKKEVASQNEEKEGKLSKKDEAYYEQICNDRYLKWLPNGEKWKAIEKYGGSVVNEVINAMFLKFPCLNEGKKPPKKYILVGIFFNDCKEEKERRKNGKK